MVRIRTCGRAVFSVLVLMSAGCDAPVDLTTALHFESVTTGWSDVNGDGGGNKLVPTVSLDIRSWEAGQALLRKWEAAGVGAELVTIPGAVAQFTADAKARHLTDATLAKYRVLLTDLEKFGKDRDIKFVRSLTIQDVREFRATWKDGAISAHQKLERLRAFLSLLQAMILTDKEKMVLTPTYHVFKMYVPFQDAAFVPVGLDAGTFTHGDVALPRLDAIAAKDAAGRVWLAITNLDPNRPVEIEAA